MSRTGDCPPASSPALQTRKSFATATNVLVGLVLRAAFVAPGRAGSPTEPTETHGPEGTGGAAGESGARYAPGDEARELRGGVVLVMRFDQGAERFTGVDSRRQGCA